MTRRDETRKPSKKKRAAYGSLVQAIRAGADALPKDPFALLTMRDVQALAGKSRATLWRYVRSGVFPAPDLLLPGDRKVWRRSTFDAWDRTRRGAEVEIVEADAPR